MTHRECGDLHIEPCAVCGSKAEEKYWHGREPESGYPLFFQQVRCTVCPNKGVAVEADTCVYPRARAIYLWNDAQERDEDETS